MNTQIKLFSILLFSFALMVCTSCCLLNRRSVTEPHMKMPKLIDYRKFKLELPTDSLELLRRYMQSRGHKFPPFIEYCFTIDTLGNVVNGQLIGPYEGPTKFFESYIENIFNNYKWQPALYGIKKLEKIRVNAIIMMTCDYQSPIFEVLIKLVNLPDKKPVDRYIPGEKDIIYKTRIGPSRYSGKDRPEYPQYD